MHSCDQQTVSHRHVKDPPARSDCPLRLDIELHADLRTRYLYLRHMNDVAPDQQRFLAGCDHVAAMTRSMAWERHSRHTWKDLAALEQVQPLAKATAGLSPPQSMARPGRFPRREPRRQGHPNRPARPHAWTPRHSGTSPGRLHRSGRWNGPGASESSEWYRSRPDQHRLQPSCGTTGPRWAAGKDRGPYRSVPCGRRCVSGTY